MDTSDFVTIFAAADRAFAWLRDSAWPLWLAHGIDRQRGGFHEHLTLDTLSCSADFRRLRVVTRQIYVFSEAMRAGLDQAREAVELGLNFLRVHARQPDGGYAWRFALDGTVIDDRRDLYDHAFVFLALASAARVIPDDQLKADVFALDNYLQLHFRHPHGGYVESLPASWPRRQNPHMHLLEAYLAAAEVFGETRFMDRADELVALFLAKFFRPVGALGEFFDDQLNVQLEGGRFVVEPGHHAEWIWLLHRYESLARSAGQSFAPRVAEAAAALARFMDRHGSGARGLMDEVWSDGAPRMSGCRLWPQTERLKAEILRLDADPGRILQSFAILEGYLVSKPAGLWHERRLQDGRFAAILAPASSLYHLTAGIVVTRENLRDRSI